MILVILVILDTCLFLQYNRSFIIDILDKMILEMMLFWIQADFYNTIETLARIAAHSRQAPEG